MFESLESRRHLSVALKNGTLKITGIDRAESVQIGQFYDEPKLVVTILTAAKKRAKPATKLEKSYSAKSVKKIIVKTAGGNDVVNVAVNKRIRLQAQGGDGNDGLFYSGLANTTMSGGSGNDTLQGTGGNDRLDGGSGNDYITGGFGSDTLIGASGVDSLLGGEGNDLILAKDRGGDAILGGNGKDTVAADLGTVPGADYNKDAVQAALKASQCEVLL